MKYSFLLVVALHLVGVANADSIRTIDRSITAEPTYVGKPHYCMLLFGPEAEFRVWLAWDPDAKRLFVDRNGNGDLTEEGEVVNAVVGKQPLIVSFAPNATLETQDFDVGSISEPGGAIVHKEIKVHMSYGVRVRLLLNGDTRYALGRLWFQPTKEKAPVYHLRKSLSFRVLAPDAFYPGERVDLKVNIGSQSAGSGFASIFCESVPSAVHPVANIEFMRKDSSKEPIKLRVTLSHRC